MSAPKNYQIPVLLYHRLVKSANDAGRHNIFVTEKNMRRQLAYLKRKGYETITFRDLQQNKTEGKKIMITFDDGYLDNYTLLFPLLKEFGFTAVIYLVTGSKTNSWDTSAGEPSLPLLSDAQIKEMHAYGIEFGGHTRSHVDLLKTSPDKRMEEIAGCKKDIETITKTPVISFAYPFGALNETIKQEIRDAGYHFAVSTRSGPYSWNKDLMQVRRIEVSKKTGLLTFARKVSGNYFTSFSFIDLISSKK